MTLATIPRYTSASSPGRLSPRQARNNVAEAFIKLENALVDQTRADDEHAERESKNAASDRAAAAVLAKGERRRAQNSEDLFLARLNSLALNLKELSRDAYSSDVGVKAVPQRLEGLANIVANWLKMEAGR
jgi:hypothetical protein